MNGDRTVRWAIAALVALNLALTLGLVLLYLITGRQYEELEVVFRTMLTVSVTALAGLVLQRSSGPPTTRG